MTVATPGGAQSSGTSQSYWKSRMNSNNNTRSTYGNCGYTHKRGQCPAQGKLCVSCKKIGHFAKVCRSRPVNELMTDTLDTNHQSQEEDSTAVDELMADLFVGMLDNDLPEICCFQHKRGTSDIQDGHRLTSQHTSTRSIRQHQRITDEQAKMQPHNILRSLHDPGW